ncbi:matrixin family metalloprotease, partial [Halorubrum sp. SP9]|uniref:matrixin family metalloprotease n=1 Tax=Halorubrum sp. SP9 TaxID=1537267 RepID=UPI00113485B1
MWGSVQYNLSNPELEYTTTHELGHMLGLDHDDPPDYVMNISRISWTPNTTRVAFRDADGGDLDAQTKQEAVEALDELTRRDVDAMYGFRWREVSSPEEAHIVIAGND